MTFAIRIFDICGPYGPPILRSLKFLNCNKTAQVLIRSAITIGLSEFPQTSRDFADIP